MRMAATAEARDASATLPSCGYLTVPLGIDHLGISVVSASRADGVSTESCPARPLLTTSWRVT